MDASATGIEALATAMSQTHAAEAVSMAMLRKTLDIQAQSAAQLIATVAPPTATSNPPHLGNSVDTFA